MLKCNKASLKNPPYFGIFQGHPLLQILLKSVYHVKAENIGLLRFTNLFIRTTHAMVMQSRCNDRLSDLKKKSCRNQGTFPLKCQCAIVYPMCKPITSTVQCYICA